MKLVDLNILIYAVNADAPEHATARRWWEALLGGDEPVGLAWPVVLGFLRLTTRGGILPKPLTPGQALDTVEEWIAHPLTVLVVPGGEHWTHFRKLVASTGLAGNLTTDAHLAAMVLEYDAMLCSTDRDFARFTSVRVINPLAGNEHPTGSQ